MAANRIDGRRVGLSLSFIGTLACDPDRMGRALPRLHFGGRVLSVLARRVSFVSIRQRLYPTPVQVSGMVEHCHHARFVFNIGLEQRAMWARDKHNRGPGLDAERVTTASQMRELAVLRKNLDWLRLGASVVQQAALRDLDRAFSNFWAGRAKYPTFKKHDARNGGFVVRDLTVRRLNKRNGFVTIPKIGVVRFRISKLWSDIEAATSARVTQRNGQWHVSFTTPAAPKIVAGTGALVGIDRGVANTITTSDGAMLTLPSLSPNEQSRFVLLQRRLTRQSKGSARRTRTLDQLAVLRGRLTNRRTDWIEQTTTDLSRTYDGFSIEHLNVSNMVRRPQPKPDPDQSGAFLPNNARAKAGLNKAIYASCWGQFATRLTHKSVVVKVPAAFSSQECRECSHVASENRESQAVFACVNCGHINHADINAARVILHRGEPALADALATPNPRTFGGSDASALRTRGPRQATQAA